MEELSRQVARLEKEFNFWTRMYPQKIPTINGTAVEQVRKLELNLGNYREMYRTDLQRELGGDFSVGSLCNQNQYNPLRNYFFPMDYQEKFAGIILPFTKEKKAIFNPRLKEDQHALEVLQKKGYRIEKVVCGYNRNEAQYLILGDEEDIALGLSMKDLI